MLCVNNKQNFDSHIFVSIPAHPFSWNSGLLKVQKHDNKQNFGCSNLYRNINIDVCLMVKYMITVARKGPLEGLNAPAFELDKIQK